MIVCTHSVRNGVRRTNVSAIYIRTYFYRTCVRTSNGRMYDGRMYGSFTKYGRTHVCKVLMLLHCQSYMLLINIFSRMVAVLLSYTYYKSLRSYTLLMMSPEQSIQSLYNMRRNLPSVKTSNAPIFFRNKIIHVPDTDSFASFPVFTKFIQYDVRIRGLY